MNLFLGIGIAVGVLILLGVLYSLMTDPARIDEEEDDEVAHESPEERHGFLRSYQRSKEDREDRIAEESKTDYGADDVNDL